MARQWLVVLVVLLGLVGTLAAVGEQPSSYARDVEPTFVKACIDCHGGDSPKKGLDLSKGKGYGHLVGTKSQEVPDVVLVKPGDAAGSYLWLKLTHAASQGKGMPRTLFSSKKLANEQLDMIQRWIIDGAQP